MIEGLRILLVEADTNSRRALAALLEACAERARITETASGQEALDVARRERPDVIVAESATGTLDGISLLEALRHEQPAMGRILVTARADLDLARAAIDRAGVHAFLQKPVTGAELGRALGSARERAAQESSLG